MVRAEFDGRDFRLTLPATLVKGGGKAAPVGGRLVEGVASTPAQDLHGERVEPSGLDLTYFERHGRINWDHGKEPSSIIGEPVDWTCTPKQFYLHARLYENVKRAEDAYALLKAGAQLAWSVEGRVTERDPDDRLHVTGALVVNVALTPNPVNPETTAFLTDRVAKSVTEGAALAQNQAGASSDLAPLVVQALEGAPQNLLTVHLALAPTCGCMAWDADGMGFVHGYAGAVAHFSRCCGAPIDQAAALAHRYRAVARVTGRQLRRENNP